MHDENPDDLPSNVLRVEGFEDMHQATKKPGKGINCILWRRGKLAGNFQGLANLIAEKNPDMGNDSLEILGFENERESFEPEINSNAGINEAFNTICRDIDSGLRGMSNRSLFSPNIICYFPKTENYLSRNVFAFHVDESMAWRFCANYHDPGTEYPAYDDSTYNRNTRQVRLKTNARIYQMQPGDIWMHAGDQVWQRKPFIHRAPALIDDKPRIGLF